MSTFWNVRPDTIERTTLAVESKERRYSTGRGYCVEALDPKAAKRIVSDYIATMRGWFPEPAIVLASRQKVIVLSRAAK